jgi:hypothetical protein
MQANEIVQRGTFYREKTTRSDRQGINSDRKKNKIAIDLQLMCRSSQKKRKDEEEKKKKKKR